MSCPTCEHTMQAIGIVAGSRNFWCPRCGTIRRVTPNLEGDFVEDEAPFWIKRTADARAIIDGTSARDDLLAACKAFLVDTHAGIQRYHDSADPSESITSLEVCEKIAAAVAKAESPC